MAIDRFRRPPASRRGDWRARETRERQVPLVGIARRVGVPLSDVARLAGSPAPARAAAARALHGIPARGDEKIRLRTHRFFVRFCKLGVNTQHDGFTHQLVYFLRPKKLGAAGGTNSVAEKTCLYHCAPQTRGEGTVEKSANCLRWSDACDGEGVTSLCPLTAAVCLRRRFVACIFALAVSDISVLPRK